MPYANKKASHATLLRSGIPAATMVLAGLLSPSTVVAQPITERLTPCLVCHGENGTSQAPGVPSLGGQPAAFVLIQLYQFREKQRIAVPMNELTAAFTDDDLRLFSDEIAKLPPPVPSDAAIDATLIETGRAAAQRHRCGFCHNPDMSGHDQIPRIGAQREDYLTKVLREYKSGERRGYDPAMVEIAVGIADDEIAALARYLATLR